MIKQSGINWRTSSDYAPDRHEIVEVNIPKFDASWQKSPFYIANLEKMSNPKKYEIWQQRYLEGFEGEMPSVKIGDIGGNEKTVGFLDGRHRYSVMRDFGEAMIPMIVPKEQAEIFRRLFS